MPDKQFVVGNAVFGGDRAMYWARMLYCGESSGAASQGLHDPYVGLVSFMQCQGAHAACICAAG